MRLHLAVFILLLSCLMSACESISLLLEGDRPARFKRINNSLYLRGVLGKTAYRRLKRKLHTPGRIDTLVFVQSDGSENDDYNLKTARLIQDAKITTKLLPTSEIASGAVDLFLAGKQRVIAPGAKLGIHSWRTAHREGKDYPRSDENHEMFWKYYQEIGIDTSFYWHTLYIASAKDIHWMSEAEIERFQLRTK